MGQPQRLLFWSAPRAPGLRALIHAGKTAEGLKRVIMVAGRGRSAEANFLASDTYLGLAEFERAHEFAEAALKLDPKLKGLYSLSGRIKQYLGDFPGSKADLEKAGAAERHAQLALDLRPTSPLARYQLARVERSRGDIEGAVRNFERVIAAEPDRLRPHIEPRNHTIPAIDLRRDFCGGVEAGFEPDQHQKQEHHG